MNRQATGGGSLPHQLNSGGEGGRWAYLEPMQAWGADQVQVGSANSVASSTNHVAQPGANIEAATDDRTRALFVHESLPSSIRGSGCSTTRKSTSEPVRQQQQAVQGRKVTKAKDRLGASGSGANTRWENHKKLTCKCAVCMQRRGELKSSWYKHDQLTCACAVCKQSRGESRPKEAHRGPAVTGGGARHLCMKHSFPTIPGKRGSWLSAYEQPSTQCWACSREFPPYEEGGLQQTPRVAPQQQSTFPSCTNVLNSSVVKSPPVLPEGCNTKTGIPIPWQRKLTNLAGRSAHCSSSDLGIPSISSSLLVPTPKCTFDTHHGRLTCEQRFGLLYHGENSNADQQAFQTSLLSTPRCSGWPKSDRTCSNKFTGTSSDGFQHCSSDCHNMQWSCENHAKMSYNCSTGLSWQNTVDRRQVEAGTGLHNAESPLFDTTKLNLAWAHNTWAPVQEASAFTAAAERDNQWHTNSSAGNMARSHVEAACSLPDPFVSLEQTTSFLGENSSSMAHVQPKPTSHSTIPPEVDNKSVYVPLRISNSLPHALAGRSSSVAQFPFGLEVQQVEHDIYQPVGDLQEPIDAQTCTFNCDEDPTESSSPPWETTSTTSIVNEMDNSSPVMAVYSGDTLRPSKAVRQGALEKLTLRTEVDAKDPARNGQQLHGGYYKGMQSTRRGGQEFSKRLGGPSDCCSTVYQKRAKRQGVSHSIPKWSKLINSESNHSTIIRKICIRFRVPKKSQSPSKALEPSSMTSTANSNARTPNLSAGGNKMEGRSRSEEFIARNGLQSTRLTGVRETTNIRPAPDKSISARDEALTAGLRESSRASPNSREISLTSLETEIKDISKKRKLNNYRITHECLVLQGTAPEVQSNNNTQIKSEVGQGEGFPLLSDSVSDDCTQGSPMMDISNVAGKARRTSIWVFNDHWGRTVQIADPVARGVLGKVLSGFEGSKRSRTELESGEGGHDRLDPSRHSTPTKLECMLQPSKKLCKRRRHHKHSEASLLKGKPVRTANSSGKIMRLTVEVLLPESMRVYYLADSLKVRTPALTIWLTELVRDMGQLSPSAFILQSDSLVPKGDTSLCSSPEVRSTAFHVLRKALELFLSQETTGLVTWWDLTSGMRVHCSCNVGEGKETTNETIIFGTRFCLDEGLFSRFCDVYFTENGFLFPPHDVFTVCMEDLISCKPLDRMIKGTSSSTRTFTKHFDFFLCDFGPNEVDGSTILSAGTKSQHGRMTVICQHEQSLTSEVQLTPLRNIVFSYWIDRPLDGCRHLAFLGILLRRSPPRFLLCCEARDQYLTSSDLDQSSMSHCKLVLSDFSTSEILEDDYNGGRQHRRQISSDGVMSEECISLSVNDLRPMEPDETPGSHEFHGECTNLAVTRSQQTPSASSFQDLLKSVLCINSTASPPLLNSSKCRTEPRKGLHELSSSGCSRRIPGLDAWEHHSVQRNDGQTSAAVTCLSDSILKPVRRRGCPKGGWPKKVKAKKNLYFSAAEKDPVEGTSHHAADFEADIELVQSTNVKISNKWDSEYKKKLEIFLDRPFQSQELNDLEEHACLRKPLLRIRETRQRVLHVATKKDGMSYLDYHPDLARKVADATAPEERLWLLRGFFFWLQHSCTSGSFKPWAPNVDKAEEADDDCVEIFPKERVVKHPSTVKSTVESIAFQCETSYKETSQTHMTLRTRGRKRKSSWQQAKSAYFSKQVKPSMDTSVKREKK